MNKKDEEGFTLIRRVFRKENSTADKIFSKKVSLKKTQTIINLHTHILKIL